MNIEMLNKIYHNKNEINNEKLNKDLVLPTVNVNNNITKRIKETIQI